MKASQCVSPFLYRARRAGTNPVNPPFKYTGPAGCVGTLYRVGFVGGLARKRALMVFRKMQKLDGRAEACSRNEANGRHASALMRKYEIVENVKGQCFG